jgi:predicted GNAT family N-acyltransferase
MSAFRVTVLKPDNPFYSQVLDLRDRILRQPIGLSLKNEDLSEEVHQTTLAAFQENELVGCVMLQPLNDNWMKVRQMAVDAGWQGNGVGHSLMDSAELHALEMKAEGIRLHARMTAVPFYERCGYEKVGATFEEVGIPHVLMQKKLL